MSLQNVYQYKDIDIDRNSTLQASLEARGPIFLFQLIDLNKLINFCSICLNKMFTNRKLSISTCIRFEFRLTPVVEGSRDYCNQKTLIFRNVL